MRSAISMICAIRSSGVLPSTPERWQWRSQISMFRIPGSSIFENLQILQVLGTAGSFLVGFEVRESDDRIGKATILTMDSVSPGITEFDAVNRSENIDTVGNNSHLKYDVGLGKILGLNSRK